tara:strand:+ start:6739 stop:7374 length:636 start_codon:yes stop_codon:yes gene_type:complete
MKQYTPNGISFEQIKKSAQKLKKQSDLTRQQALNQVVRDKTTFPSWEKLLEIDKKRLGSFAKIKTDKRDIVLFNEKPIIQISNFYKNELAILKQFYYKKKTAVISHNSFNHVVKNCIKPYDLFYTNFGSFDYVILSDLDDFDKHAMQEVDKIIDDNKNTVFVFATALSINHLPIFNKVNCAVTVEPLTIKKEKKFVTFDIESNGFSFDLLK